MQNETNNLQKAIEEVEGKCHISSAPYPMGIIHSDTLLLICSAAKQLRQVEKERDELKNNTKDWPKL